MGRMSISTDLVASAGSWSSRKVPRMDWEPTTITSCLPMIWHACGSRAQAVLSHQPCLLESGLPFILGEWAAHWRRLAHFDGFAVKAGQDPMQGKHVAVPDEQTK
jgi:hypothetical protein